MGRLTTLKPRVGAAPQPRVRSHVVERDRSRAFQRARARYLSDHPLCVECERQGRVSAAVELDHVVPLWKGGGNDDANLAGLCRPCHLAKTAEEAKERAQGG